MSENTAVETDNNSNTEQIDWEARAKKAEAKIVDMKKSSEEAKEEKTPNEEVVKEKIQNPTVSESDIEAIIAKRDFFKSNPDFIEYKEDIDKFVSAGLTLEEAKNALIAQDSTIMNRQKTNTTSIASGEAGGSKNSYSQEELASMPFEERVKAYDLVSKGKIKVV